MTAQESSDDRAVSDAAEILGENIINLMATAARTHNVSITINIVPLDITSDASRDPNDNP